MALISFGSFFFLPYACLFMTLISNVVGMCVKIFQLQQLRLYLRKKFFAQIVRHNTNSQTLLLTDLRSDSLECIDCEQF